MFKVLIVDDESLMREALNIMISKVGGFEVAYSASNGEDAIEICKHEDVSIVFMDIVMPGISGIEASKQIQKLNKDISIFIISSYNPFEFAEDILMFNIKKYISKPVSFSTIENLLTSYKETSIVNPKQLTELFSLIENKDFKQAYYAIPQISKEIYRIDKDYKQITKNFLFIGQRLIDYIEWYKLTSNKKCEELFPFDNALTLKEKRFEFWIYEIMNYVFQQRAIQKYEILKNVFIFIESNIKKNIGLNQIVDNCAVSQGYISRIFKSQFNISVMEYIHMRKLTIAKAYLAFTEMSVADIAFELGYNESGYFSKVFKKYENLTVFQYRKTFKDDKQGW